MKMEQICKNCKHSDFSNIKTDFKLYCFNPKCDSEFSKDKDCSRYMSIVKNNDTCKLFEALVDNYTSERQYVCPKCGSTDVVNWTYRTELLCHECDHFWVNDYFTGFFDDYDRAFFVGDKLKNEYGFEVIVVKDEDGDYSGKLVCDDEHHCKDIPISLNQGKGYRKIMVW